MSSDFTIYNEGEAPGDGILDAQNPAGDPGLFNNLNGQAVPVPDDTGEVAEESSSAGGTRYVVPSYLSYFLFNLSF